MKSIVMIRSLYDHVLSRQWRSQVWAASIASLRLSAFAVYVDQKDIGARFRNSFFFGLFCKCELELLRTYGGCVYCNLYNDALWWIKYIIFFLAFVQRDLKVWKMVGYYSRAFFKAKLLHFATFCNFTKFCIWLATKSSSSFLLLAFLWELRGHQLEIKPPHFMVFHHIHHFAWVKVPNDSIQDLQCSWSIWF